MAGIISGPDPVRVPGFKIGQSLAWVNKETRDGGDAGVDKTFNSDLGIVEALHVVGSVVAFSTTPDDGCRFEIWGVSDTWLHHVSSSSDLEQN